MLKVLLSVVWLLLAVGVYAAGPVIEDTRPLMAVLDVSSSSYEPALRTHLTNIIRTELFKTNLFRIIERGIIQKVATEQKIILTAENADSQILALGKSLSVEKLFVASVEKFSKIFSVNVRIVDVATGLVSFTDNVNVESEDLLTDALKEVVIKIDVHYRGKDNSTGVGPQILTEAQKQDAIWKRLGAQGPVLDFLIESGVNSDEYLFLRQYDITFTPSDYVDLLVSATDIKIIKTFLQAGINFQQTKRALKLGITQLDKYRESFQKFNYEFRDYLEAYENNITNPVQYKQFKQGFDRHFAVFGLGGLAESLPLGAAKFTFGVAQVALERYWNENQRDLIRYSSTLGMFILTRAANNQPYLAPVPYFTMNISFGQEPYYFTASIGGHVEAVIGGHAGILIALGAEVMRQLEFKFLIVPWGTQPGVTYIDFTSREGDPGYVPLKFPYFGMIFSYKLPVSYLDNTFH